MDEQLESDGRASGLDPLTIAGFALLFAAALMSVAAVMWAYSTSFATVDWGDRLDRIGRVYGLQLSLLLLGGVLALSFGARRRASRRDALSAGVLVLATTLVLLSVFSAWHDAGEPSYDARPWPYRVGSISQHLAVAVVAALVGRLAAGNNRQEVE